MGSMDEFEITVTGEGGHGASPHNTIDPIVISAQLIMALQTIVSRKVDPIQPAVVSVGKFQAGERPNIIPSRTYMAGTIRCQDKHTRQLISEQITAIANGICESAGASCHVNITNKVPATINDPELCNDFIKRSSELLEREAIEIPDHGRMYSEDFSLYGDHVPILLFYLGTRNESKGCIHPLHSPLFKIDEDILPLGTALFVNYCLSRDQ